jgi:hypothetical protein
MERHRKVRVPRHFDDGDWGTEDHKARRQSSPPQRARSCDFSGSADVNIWLARAIGTVAVARKQVTRAIELGIGLGFL